MVRNYKRKTEKVSEIAIAAALRAHRSGMNYSQASRQFGVPRSILKRRSKRPIALQGCMQNRVFNDDQEEALKMRLRESAMEHSWSNKVIRRIAYEYAVELLSSGEIARIPPKWRPKDDGDIGTAGADWLHGFMQRHSDITLYRLRNKIGEGFTGMDLFPYRCRLCKTSSPQAHKWPNVLSAENRYLLLQIHTCTGVEISVHDKLPKRICDLCQLKLTRAYNFRQQCEETNAQFQLEMNILGNQDWEPGSPTPSTTFELLEVVDDEPEEAHASEQPAADFYIKEEPEDYPELEIDVLHIKQEAECSDSEQTPEMSTDSESIAIGITHLACSQSFHNENDLRQHNEHSYSQAVASESVIQEQKLFTNHRIMPHLTNQPPEEMNAINVKAEPQPETDNDHQTAELSQDELLKPSNWEPTDYS